jgi:hypothetical protein
MLDSELSLAQTTQRLHRRRGGKDIGHEMAEDALVVTQHFDSHRVSIDAGFARDVACFRHPSISLVNSDGLRDRLSAKPRSIPN